MPKYSTAFGMDVHLRSTTVCALDADTGEAVTRRFPGNPWGEIAGWMDGFPGPSLAAYESGYLGFAPQRELAGLGVECVVAAVSKIPRSAADSASKNDRNDADLCQDFGHGIERNHAAIGIASGLGSGRSKKASLGSVRSKKSAMASAGTL